MIDRTDPSRSPLHPVAEDRGSARAQMIVVGNERSMPSAVFAATAAGHWRSSWRRQTRTMGSRPTVVISAGRMPRRGCPRCHDDGRTPIFGKYCADDVRAPGGVSLEPPRPLRARSMATNNTSTRYPARLNTLT